MIKYLTILFLVIKIFSCEKNIKVKVFEKRLSPTGLISPIPKITKREYISYISISCSMYNRVSVGSKLMDENFSKQGNSKGIGAHSLTSKYYIVLEK